MDSLANYGSDNESQESSRTLEDLNISSEQDEHSSNRSRKRSLQDDDKSKNEPQPSASKNYKPYLDDTEDGNIHKKDKNYDRSKDSKSKYDYKENDDRNKDSELKRARNTNEDRSKKSREEKFKRHRRSRSKDRRRSSSRDRKRSSSRDRKRSTSRDRRPSSRDRRPTSRDRRPTSRDRRPSSRDRKRSTSRDRRRSTSRDRRSPRKIDFKNKDAKDINRGSSNKYKTKFDRTSNKLAQLEKMGIEIPKFYNPATANPPRYADQIQKRRLLWQKKAPETVTQTSSDAGSSSGSVSGSNVAGSGQGKVWELTTFAKDNDGKVASKFKRLMGIKDTETPLVKESDKDILKKQEEMFSSMEQQYEVARTTTHTMRGVGLGFGSYNNYPH